MNKVQLPIMKGLLKDENLDYIDALPINLLATPKEVLSSNGYLRSFPGIVTLKETEKGTSRGGFFNVHDNQIYRVYGDGLYINHLLKHTGIKGSARVSFACSYNSTAIAHNGTILFAKYNGVGYSYLSNWEETELDLSNVIDVCRYRGRYIWAQKGNDLFYASSLEDETKPDKTRPYTRAETQPDGILGVDVWRDFLVCFGTSTIEYFSLTGYADETASLYQNQPSLMVQKGIAATHCKTRFADTHAFISHPSSGQPSVYLIDQGSAQKISTATIDKMLSKYDAIDFENSFMESVKMNSHELLILHLPKETLCYDAAASQENVQWFQICTDLGNKAKSHRAIDYIFDGKQVTVGDKYSGLIGAFDFSLSSQYGEIAEHIAFTPIVKLDNARLFDLEIESASGIGDSANGIFLSVTVDGLRFGREQSIKPSSEFNYNSRILWRKVGRVTKNIGFKVRITATKPVSISNLSVRIA